jgi:hypothetical protein
LHAICDREAASLLRDLRSHAPAAGGNFWRFSSLSSLKLHSFNLFEDSNFGGNNESGGKKRVVFAHRIFPLSKTSTECRLSAGSSSVWV